MKKVVMTCFIFYSFFFFILGLFTVAYAEVEVVRDRFDGTIKVETKLSDPFSDFELLDSPLGALMLQFKQPHIHLSGVQHSAKEKHIITITLYSISKHWRYLDCHEMKWLVDGQPFKFPQPKHDGSAFSTGGGVQEHLKIYPVTLKQIEKIAKAEKVEYKVCDDEYTVTSEEMDDFKDFFSKLQELNKN